jgi:Protein of unknown function (DUF2637)
MKIRRRPETPEQEIERLQREEGARNHAAHLQEARQVWRERQKAERQARRAARKGRRQERQADAPLPGSLRVPRLVALVAIAVVVGASALTSFAESYRGLFDWAREHTLTGTWAAVWPLMVDSFIAVGELALFVGLADRWRLRQRLGAWATTLVGLAVSVAGNVGHVHGQLLSDRATAAVPPLAAFAALWVGLGVLKRVVAAHAGRSAAGVPGVPVQLPAVNGHGPEAERLFAADLAAGNVPGIRRIRSALHLGQDKAQQVQAYLAAVAASTAERPSAPDHDSGGAPAVARQHDR